MKVVQFVYNYPNLLYRFYVCLCMLFYACFIYAFMYAFMYILLCKNNGIYYTLKFVRFEYLIQRIFQWSRILWISRKCVTNVSYCELFMILLNNVWSANHLNLLSFNSHISIFYSFRSSFIENSTRKGFIWDFPREIQRRFYLKGFVI